MADNAITTFTIDTGTVLNAALILIVAYLLVWGITFALIRFSERLGIHRITTKMVLPLLKFSIYGFALYFILTNIFNISFRENIAFSGFLGAAIGFGLKDLFADLLGGITIALEKP